MVQNGIFNAHFSRNVTSGTRAMRSNRMKKAQTYNVVGAGTEARSFSVTTVRTFSVETASDSI